VTVNHSRA